MDLQSIDIIKSKLEYEQKLSHAGYDDSNIDGKWTNNNQKYHAESQ